MKWKRITSLVSLIAVVGWPCFWYFYFAPNFFSDHLTSVTYMGERYHVIPESELGETLVIVDNDGNKHYVLSEKKLRLLGPKLLTGGD